MVEFSFVDVLGVVDSALQAPSESTHTLARKKLINFIMLPYS
jgi:hypothetical protein